jgi:hypothetical protein
MIVGVGLLAALAVGQREKPPARPGMPDVSAQKAAMQKLAKFVGTWRGTGSMQMGPDAHAYDQTETCEWELDGLILKIQGRGVQPNAPADAKPVHHAFAVINYDDRTQKYQFRAYTAMGFANTFDFEVRDDGTYAWGMKMPGNETRYHITITDDTWHEIGERSSDGGRTWTKFLEMNLQKVKE